MSNSAPTHELHFVIGGAGFLGSHILEALVARGETAVASFDIREPTERVPNVHYYEGDLTQAESLTKAITDAQEDTRTAGIEGRSVAVYHTASPVAGLGPDVYEKVNVLGTEVVIEVCKEPKNGVAKLIFTSSAGVVFNGYDLKFIDERVGYPQELWREQFPVEQTNRHGDAVVVNRAVDAQPGGEGHHVTCKVAHVVFVDFLR